MKMAFSFFPGNLFLLATAAILSLPARSQGTTKAAGQQQSGAAKSDSIHLDYRKIYSLTLDGDARAALPLIDKDTLRLSQMDKKFKKDFEARFKYTEDRSRYPDNATAIDGLLAIYKKYWRRSVLDPTRNGDSVLMLQVAAYLAAQYPPAAGLVTAGGQVKADTSLGDSIDHYIVPYLASLHLYTNGFGRVGRLYDLLVWKQQRDTSYAIAVSGDTIRVSVTFMIDFVTLGWEDYTTLGRHYPAGWATDVSLFCVQQAYDLNSETFLVSYLAHEGKHFADYKLFPKLKSTDLEYRAKLTELSIADTTLIHLIDFFSSNANLESGNGHSVANYCAIRDLSRVLFKNDFEKNMDKWKQLDRSVINAAAANILREETRILKTGGKDVVSYIKNEKIATF